MGEDDKSPSINDVIRQNLIKAASKKTNQQPQSDNDLNNAFRKKALEKNPNPPAALPFSYPYINSGIRTVYHDLSGDTLHAALSSLGNLATLNAPDFSKNLKENEATTNAIQKQAGSPIPQIAGHLFSMILQNGVGELTGLLKGGQAIGHGASEARSYLNPTTLENIINFAKETAQATPRTAAEGAIMGGLQAPQEDNPVNRLQNMATGAAINTAAAPLAKAAVDMSEFFKKRMTGASQEALNWLRYEPGQILDKANTKINSPAKYQNDLNDFHVDQNKLISNAEDNIKSDISDYLSGKKVDFRADDLMGKNDTVDNAIYDLVKKSDAPKETLKTDISSYKGLSPRIDNILEEAKPQNLGGYPNINPLPDRIDLTDAQRIKLKTAIQQLGESKMAKAGIDAKSLKSNLPTSFDLPASGVLKGVDAEDANDLISTIDKQARYHQQSIGDINTFTKYPELKEASAKLRQRLFDENDLPVLAKKRSQLSDIIINKTNLEDKMANNPIAGLTTPVRGRMTTDFRSMLQNIDEAAGTSLLNKAGEIEATNMWAPSGGWARGKLGKATAMETALSGILERATAPASAVIPRSAKEFINAMFPQENSTPSGPTEQPQLNQ